MTENFENQPVTVPDLIAHDDVVGRVFVCNTADLEPAHLAELPRFLQRLDDESRPVPRSERATMIVILGHEFLPADPASVATARLWYWDRVARWDVAALLAAHSSPEDLVGVLGEVRLETIIEVSRWDFELAVELAHDWSGDYLEITEIVGRRTGAGIPDLSVKTVALKRPPALRAHLESWDDGVLESWHGIASTTPASSLATGKGLVGHFWSAQARVLLPWIEVRRASVESMVREKLGPVKMAAATGQYSTRYPEIEFDATLVELPTLARIISARFGASEEPLRESTRVLRAARNRLAHFKPLTRDELYEMVQSCEWLD
jgi:hypothetical protein